MKSYYDECANHCIRFYAKYPEPPEFRTDVDRRNWHAVNNAVSENTNVTPPKSNVHKKNVKLTLEKIKSL